MSGVWILPPTTVPIGTSLTISGSVKIAGDLILLQNSTLKVVTVTGTSATVIDVAGCVQSDNATLEIQLDADVGDTRAIGVINTGCLRGSFAETKVESNSCQKFKGQSLYTGTRVSVLLQNDESGCQTPMKYVILAVIFSVVAVIALVAVVTICIYQYRDRLRRIQQRRNHVSAQYARFDEK